MTQLNIFENMMLPDGRTELKYIFRDVIECDNSENLEDYGEKLFRLSWSLRKTPHKVDRKKSKFFVYTPNVPHVRNINGRDSIISSKMRIARKKLMEILTRYQSKSPLPLFDSISGKGMIIYAWLHANYQLSPNIRKQRSDQDAVVLNLDNSFAQIAFRPNSWILLTRLGIKKTLTIPIDDNYSPGVYSTSFTDFGTSVNVLKLLGAYKATRNTLGYYKSPCLPAGFASPFKVNQVVIKVKGAPVIPKERFDLCYKRQVQIIKTYMYNSAQVKKEISVIRKLLQIESKFIAVGQFFKVASYITNFKALKVNPSNYTCHGYEMTVNDYILGARKICEHIASSSTDKPYLAYSCLTATYVVSLLKQFYKLPPSTTIFACKNLHNLHSKHSWEEKLWHGGLILQDENHFLLRSTKLINHM